MSRKHHGDTPAFPVAPRDPPEIFYIFPSTFIGLYGISVH